jgi:hypothetical protein
MAKSIDDEIDETVDLFVTQYQAIAGNFSMVKGFLSAAVGHAAAGVSDRSGLQTLLRNAADAFDHGKPPRSKHTRPLPWTPTNGTPDAEALTAQKLSATISSMYQTRPGADRAVLNSAALRAAFIMMAWHDHKVVAAVLRTKAEALKDLPFNVH